MAEPEASPLLSVEAGVGLEEKNSVELSDDTQAKPTFNLMRMTTWLHFGSKF